MITPTQIYWLTRFDEIKELTSDLTGISLVLCVVFIVGSIILSLTTSLDPYAEDSTRKTTSKAMKTVFILASCLLLLSIGLLSVGKFIPTTKEVAAIYVIPRLANSETVQKLPSIASTVVDLAEDWLKELKPTKEGK